MHQPNFLTQQQLAMSADIPLHNYLAVVAGIPTVARNSSDALDVAVEDESSAPNVSTTH